MRSHTTSLGIIFLIPDVAKKGGQSKSLTQPHENNRLIISRVSIPTFFVYCGSVTLRTRCAGGYRLPEPSIKRLSHTVRIPTLWSSISRSSHFSRCSSTRGTTEHSDRAPQRSHLTFACAAGLHNGNSFITGGRSIGDQ